MNELLVTLGDQSYRFTADQIVRIGRSLDNTIVVGDPTVSRLHAQLSMSPDGWVFENVGRALSFLDGRPVSRAVLSGPAEIQLSSSQGPVLSLTPDDGWRSPWPDDGEPAVAAYQEAPYSPGSVLPDPVLPDPVLPDPVLPDPVIPDPIVPDPVFPHPVMPDPVLPDPVLPDPVVPDPGLPGPVVPDPALHDPALHDPALPDPALFPDQPELPDEAERTSVLDRGLAGPAVPNGTGYPGEPGQPYGAAYPGDSGAAGYPGTPGPAEDGMPRIRPVAAQPVDELATALHILLPVRSWLHDPGWRQFLRLLVIPYALLPLIFIALFASSSNLATPGWAYSLYIAPLWAIAFWLLIRPGQVTRQEVGIGVGAVAFLLVWIRIITVHVNGLMGTPGKPLSFFGAIGVGINEEITKALPILIAALLLLRLRSTKLDVRMWMFLGAIVGLAFGVTEQAGYTLQDIEGIASSQGNSQAIVEVLAFAERVFVDGFQHALWAGVSAFFIGMAVNYPRRRIQLIAFGIALPAVLHGLYDWSAGAFGSLWVPIIIQALSLFLFLGYTMSATAIERQVRRTPMFRGESMLMERIPFHHQDPGRSSPGRHGASGSRGASGGHGAHGGG